MQEAGLQFKCTLLMVQHIRSNIVLLFLVLLLLLEVYTHALL
uniref:Uncharacterized protein n=1 Tax=Amphimedon queenslandica TaxID=400682 RepID=A0A1X7TDI4_AMPQE